MSKASARSPRGHRVQRGESVQREWQLQDAKARFSEVFRLARESGPQRVTKQGREGNRPPIGA